MLEQQKIAESYFLLKWIKFIVLYCMMHAKCCKKEIFSRSLSFQVKMLIHILPYCTGDLHNIMSLVCTFALESPKGCFASTATSINMAFMSV